MNTIQLYEDIFQAQLAGERDKAESMVYEINTCRFSDFINYACVKIEETNNVEIRQAWRSIRHHMLDRVDQLTEK